MFSILEYTNIVNPATPTVVLSVNKALPECRSPMGIATPPQWMNGNGSPPQGQAAQGAKPAHLVDYAQEGGEPPECVALSLGGDDAPLPGDRLRTGST